jgi:hypothetical protein
VPFPVSDDTGRLPLRSDPETGPRNVRNHASCRHWPVLPPRMPANGRVVKVGWSTWELDPHEILLLSGGGGLSGGVGTDRRVGHAGGVRPGDHRTLVCRFP